jgi:hydrogen peroxide-dependent heme synthase
VAQTESSAVAGASPVIPSEGWSVLHLAYSDMGDPRAPVELEEAAALVDAFEADDDYQCFSYAIVGKDAQLGLMLIGPDLARLHRLVADLRRTELGARLQLVPELSYVSITEASEYLPEDGSERIATMRRQRMYPRGMKKRRLLCFYPMSKRRGGDANWYTLPYEERKRLMYGHGATGRAYAGRIAQMITASTGLSDYEWGVTLLADDLKAIKDVVYEMRYDEGSAIYGEFGSFYLGLVSPFREAVAEAGFEVAG